MLVFLLAFSGSAQADFDTGDSVVVVYNTRLPESKAVADHYAQRRLVPGEQILGLDLPTTETMTRAEFRNDLQKPLFKWLERKRLFNIKLDTAPGNIEGSGKLAWRVKEAKIRYAVLCHGVPLRVERDNSLREEQAEKLPEPLRRNEASVDSELSLLPMSDFKMTLAGPVKNPFYGITNAADMTPVNGLLLVARLDGPTPEIARALVDKAIQAEQDGLWGRAYIDLRDIADENFKLGDEWLGKAATLSRRLGFETVIDNKPETFRAAFPMSHIAFYSGWYDEHASGPFSREKVEFMPGAFAYHLHSFSAATLRSNDKHWAGPLLAKGATAVMGCVDEPYLSMTPDISAFLGRFIYQGFSFGEAAYACQPALSWQTTVVGDPLYRPFAQKPQKLHEDLVKSNNPLVEWSHLRVVNLNLANNYPITEAIDYLEEHGKQSAVLLEKLGELYLSQGKTWSAIGAWTRALDHKPSPQQEIRLLATLGEQLDAAGKPSEALSMYKLLLKKHKDYPGAESIYKHMLLLANKTSKPQEVEAILKELQRLGQPKS